MTQVEKSHEKSTFIKNIQRRNLGVVKKHNGFVMKHIDPFELKPNDILRTKAIVSDDKGREICRVEYHVVWNTEDYCPKLNNVQGHFIGHVKDMLVYIEKYESSLGNSPSQIGKNSFDLDDDDAKVLEFIESKIQKIKKYMGHHIDIF